MTKTEEKTMEWEYEELFTGFWNTVFIKIILEEAGFPAYRKGLKKKLTREFIMDLLKKSQDSFRRKVEENQFTELEIMCFEHMQRAWFEKVTKETDKSWIQLSDSLSKKIKQRKEVKK